MTRRYWRVVLLIVFALFVSSCSVTSSLTQQQLQEFIRQEHIQPVLVEDVGGDVTVIMYKDANKMGCDMVFARNGIEAIQNSDTFANLRGDAIKPVSFTYNSILGYDIVCLTINDSQIRQDAHIVKIIFSNNEEITDTVNNSDMILYRASGKSTSRITIIFYDRDQKEIFRSR